MSGAFEKSLPSWRQALVGHGFGILCIRDSEGERFTIAAADATKVASLNEQGFRAGALISEVELRAQLTGAGFSEADIEAGIQLARDWATTITREPGSKSVLPFGFPDR